MNLHIMILAAGKGSRMKSKLPKVLHPLAGQPLLQHVINTSESLNPEIIQVIIGHQAEMVQQAIVDSSVQWTIQEKQLGTGHAVMQGLDMIPDNAEVLVLYGDVPLIASATLHEMLNELNAGSLPILTVDLPDPSGYGRIVRDAAGEVRAIVEDKDATQEQKSICEVNTGILAAHARDLKAWLPELSNNNSQGEYYLTDVIERAVIEGREVVAIQPESVEQVQGVNNRLQLCELECFVQSQIAEHLMLNGVTLFDPNRIDVRGNLETGIDVTIDVNTVFEGNVRLEDDVMIGANCYLKDVTIGRGTVVHPNSILEASTIGQGAQIGPFARVRPGTELKNNTKLGNFVETKKTIVGEGSKINHLSYVGDAILGEKVNVGAGTITCNYDGANKFVTTLEDGVFVGSNTALVAPVVVEKDATIAAGSVITATVKKEQLAVARGKQRNIDNWPRPKKIQK